MISYAVENPCHSGIELLIEALNIEIDSMTPAETNQKLTVKDMDNPTTTVIVARDNGVAVACGALVWHNKTTGEIKRMYTMPEYRGKGISREILSKLERIAIVGFNLRELVLETGYNYNAAIALYKKLGWVECPPVLDYEANPYSVFFRKAIL